MLTRCCMYKSACLIKLLPTRAERQVECLETYNWHACIWRTFELILLENEVLNAKTLFFLRRFIFACRITTRVHRLCNDFGDTLCINNTRWDNNFNHRKYFFSSYRYGKILFTNVLWYRETCNMTVIIFLHVEIFRRFRGHLHFFLFFFFLWLALISYSW